MGGVPAQLQLGRRKSGKSGPSRDRAVTFGFRGVVWPARHSRLRSGVRNKTNGFKATLSW